MSPSKIEGKPRFSASGGKAPHPYGGHANDKPQISRLMRVSIWS